MEIKQGAKFYARAMIRCINMLFKTFSNPHFMQEQMKDGKTLEVSMHKERDRLFVHRAITFILI